MQEAEELWVRVAPEEEPFKWKYEARARLLSAQVELRGMLTEDGDADVGAAGRSVENCDRHTALLVVDSVGPHCSA